MMRIVHIDSRNLFPGIPPQILVAPNQMTHVTTGVTFVLSCQALGTPTPTVRWLRDGQSIPKNISRISVFESAGKSSNFYLIHLTKI